MYTGWSTVSLFTPAQLRIRMERAKDELEKLKKEPPKKKSKLPTLLVPVPPILVPIQDTRQMSAKNLKKGDIMTAEFLKDLFNVAQVIVDKMGSGESLNDPSSFRNPFEEWMKSIPEIPSIAVYGETRTRRLPVTLALKRTRPEMNCIDMLQDCMIKANFPMESPEIKFVLCQFSAACVMDTVLAKMVKKYVHKGCWIPPGLQMTEEPNSSYTIAWTCVARVAMLETLALRYEDKDLAFSAHVCMQMHCPLAIYIQNAPDISDYSLRLNRTMYDCVYPRPNCVCWCYSCWDMAPVIGNNGFFPNKSKRATGRRKKQEKKNDFNNPDHVHEHMVAGFNVLQNIFYKALPKKCVIRSTVDKIISETEVDSSIGTILLEIFYCSMLGGYPDVEFRPSFITLVHLYECFFVAPKPIYDMLEWFREKRNDEEDHFLFDENEDYHHLWEGHHCFPRSSESYVINKKRGYSCQAVDREFAKEKRNNFGMLPSLGKTSSKQTEDDKSYQRLLTMTFQEMMRFTIPNVPGLYNVIIKYRWTDIMKSVTNEMDTLRRCIDSATRLKHRNAMKMRRPAANKEYTFPQLFELAWPASVFLHTTQIVQNRENSPYQLYNPVNSFEDEVLLLINKLDSTRKTYIEMYNAFPDKRKFYERYEDILKTWAIFDPHNLGKAMYLPDYLEYRDPMFVKHITEFKVLSDQAHRIPEAPAKENVLFIGGIDISVVKRLEEIHQSQTGDSENTQLNNLLSSLAPGDLAFIRFFYAEHRERRKLQIYRLPRNILEKQKLAVVKKHKLNSVDEITPEMTTYLICPSCGDFKGYLANEDPRDVTAFGNDKAAVDPFTGKVYCANKIKKQSTTRIDKDQTEIQMDIEKHERRRKGEEMDSKDLKKHKRIHTCHWKSQEKNEVQMECNQTELIPFNLLGTWGVYDRDNYLLCMNCSCPMQLSSNSFKGAEYTCGNCTSEKSVVYSTCCAKCGVIFFPSDEMPFPIPSDAKKIMVKAELESRAAGLMDMPVYKKDWVAHTIFDDSPANSDASKVAFQDNPFGKYITPPKIAIVDPNSDKWIKTIYLCPDHDEGWTLFMDTPIKWSVLWSGLEGRWYSWYSEEQRIFIAKSPTSRQVDMMFFNRMERQTAKMSNK